MRALARNPAILVLLLASAVIAARAVMVRELGVILVVPAFTLFLLVSLWRGQRKSVMGLREEQKTVTMELTEARFIVADGESRLERSWKALTHFAEVPSAFHVHQAGGQFNVLPKKVLSEAQIDLARRWLTRHLAPTPPRGPSRFGRTLILWVVLLIVFYAIYVVSSKS
jgi:hypothetical protein